jgi:hypothetical protein
MTPKVHSAGQSCNRTARSVWSAGHAPALAEDIMVFGQAPCSAGRRKPRRVYYLGLAGAATSGQLDITDPYIARFVEPRPGQKVFIVTC